MSIKIAFLVAIWLIMCKALEHSEKESMQKCPRIVEFPGNISFSEQETRAQFECPTDTYLYGYYNVTCQNGSWSGAPPVCTKSGCLPVDLGYSNHDDMFLDMDQLYEGSVLLFRCGTVGAYLRGPTEVYCNGTAWSESLPSCQHSRELEKCDFEESMCEWTHADADSGEWRRSTGPIPARDNRFISDKLHTTNSHYLYFETSEQNPTRQARIMSPVYTERLGRNCFDFSYYMADLGDKGNMSVSKLKVYKVPALQPVNWYDRPSFQLAGNHGNVWRRSGTIEIYAHDWFWLIIEATGAMKGNSVFAFDDVRLRSCDTLQTTPNVVSMTPTQTETPLPEMTTEDAPHNCSVLSIPGRQCPRLTSFTGKVRYSRRGDIAHFQCPRDKILYGNKNVSCQWDGTWNGDTPVCIKSGCEPLEESTLDDFSLEYEVSLGGGLIKFYCDYLKIIVGPSEIYCDGKSWSGAPPGCSWHFGNVMCDFEDSMCGWSEDNGKNQKWVRDWIRTGEADTIRNIGPPRDHTNISGSNHGHYMYFKTSNPSSCVEKTRLISSHFEAYGGTPCIEFWYFMTSPRDKQHHISLEVFAYNDQYLPENSQPLFHTKGDKGSVWHKAQIPIYEMLYTLKVAIQVTKTMDIASAVGIDDVHIYNCILPTTKIQPTTKILPATKIQPTTKIPTTTKIPPTTEIQTTTQFPPTTKILPTTRTPWIVPAKKIPIVIDTNVDQPTRRNPSISGEISHVAKYSHSSKNNVSGPQTSNTSKQKHRRPQIKKIRFHVNNIERTK